MKIALLTIGDELLSGVTVNTNAAWLGNQLMEHGFPVDECVTVGDETSRIRRSLKYLWESHELVIVTGGLGPTRDDVTPRAVAEFFHSKLVFHEPTFDSLKQRLTSRGIEITEQHKQQSMVPEKAEILANDSGTAPVLHFRQDGRELFCLPGVPYEMKHLVQSLILPMLEQKQAVKYVTRLIRTAGVPESTLFHQVEDIIHHLPDGTVAFLPHIYGVDIRLILDESAAQKYQLPAVVKDIRERLGSVVYTDREETLPAVVGNLLRERELTLATVESCTGGLLADEITNIPGSSDYFLEGVVTYSNPSKIQRLGVPEELLREHGAVSEQVARAMTEGIRRSSGADTALATTGIAGPTGGTSTKPVGLVFIGYAIGETVNVRRFEFGGDRELNKARAVYAALNLLRLELKNTD
ncbi:MAG TPA: competence/damage-inducible protein A [bacterium]|nr:competence/damage-inducible protein A [bacterium]